MATVSVDMATMQVVVNNGRPLLIHHKYSDVKWLYRLLAQKVDLNGHIVSHVTRHIASCDVM